MLFVDMLQALIRKGHLTLIDADGRRHEIGGRTGTHGNDQAVRSGPA